MKQSTPPDFTIPIRILLAEDDQDDRFFFNKVLQDITMQTHLMTVEDGEELMTTLNDSSTKLPDILFLDLNMPRKNGMECLDEIKSNQRLKNLPVVIHSTSAHRDEHQALYEKGAHYYFHKTTLDETKIILHYVLSLLKESTFIRPSREEFVLTTTHQKFQPAKSKYSLHDKK